jgi:DNA polymerase
MLSYSMPDSADVVFHDMSSREDFPDDFMALVKNPEVMFWAFNAQFERVMLNEIGGLDLPRERWKCTMALANNLGFSGRLDSIRAQVGLSDEVGKLKSGMRLIQRFCKPQPDNHKVERWTRKNDPDGWEEFGAYNMQDVVAEHAIHDSLGSFPQPHWPDYWLDQKINDHGVALDKDYIQRAQAAAALNKAQANTVLKQITGLDNPNSTQQLRAWVNEQLDQFVGGHLENMTANTVVTAIDSDDIPDHVRQVLRLRQVLAKTSVSKLDALMRAMCDDEILRGVLQFMGAARTHRWAGRIFQPQNLPRPVVDQDEAALAILLGRATMDQISSALRGALISYEKLGLGVADLSGIEGRLLPWLCFDEAKLARIYSGEDMYIHAAVAAFGVPYDDVDKDQRQVGKVIELACGYQGAVGAFQQMAEGYGLDLPDAQVKRMVNAWREQNKPIVDFWYAVQRAAEKAMRHEGTVFPVGRVEICVHAGFMWIRLPSGAYLSYYQPAFNDRGDITYMGMNSYSRKWERLQTYGGKLVENITQSVARDVLTEWLRRMNHNAYTPVLHVHDEVVWELSDYLNMEEVNDVISLITTPIEWAPDLILKAEGFTCERYRK